MKFLQRNKSERTILVISDIHLGAGHFYEGSRNVLEDFHHDQELVEFLNFFSTGEYLNKDVQLVINGDFFDFLAVPFVRYFDDEFWSEYAAIDKLKLILEAHSEVIDGLRNFVSKKNKRIDYIIGNHDGELVLPSVQKIFLQQFKEELLERIDIHDNDDILRPHPQITIKHGHQYEYAHSFDLKKSIITSSKGTQYFLPPWGSYFVTRVVNKFKEERSYINEVKPIKNMLIHGMIYDTLFTLRFIFTTCYYFIMVHYISFMKTNGRFSLLRFIEEGKKELALFHNLETLAHKFFQENESQKVLIVGHTHEPGLRELENGKIYINTGTWTRMVHLDFSRLERGHRLTFAQIDIIKDKENESFVVDLNEWQGRVENPYKEYY